MTRAMKEDFALFLGVEVHDISDVKLLNGAYVSTGWKGETLGSVSREVYDEMSADSDEDDFSEFNDALFV